MFYSANRKIKYLLYVNIMFAVYSFTGVLGKNAAAEGTVNARFIVFYACSLCLMAVYAIVWQKVIKELPLMVAYANKAIVVLWGLIWGMMFFHEAISVWRLIGIAMVMAGIVLFARTEG